MAIGRTHPHRRTAAAIRRFIAVLALMLLAASPHRAAAQSVDAPTCALLSGVPMIEAELFFGRNIGDALGVSDQDWEQFVEQEVSPRFPDGVTVQEAAGQWRDPATGRLVREPSKVLTILAPMEPATYARLRELADAYKARFRQQAVGTVLRPACVSF